MILTCEGEVFFATHSIESYLGFHQVNIHFYYIISILFSITIKIEEKKRLSKNFKSGLVLRKVYTGFFFTL